MQVVCADLFVSFSACSRVYSVLFFNLNLFFLLFICCEACYNFSFFFFFQSNYAVTRIDVFFYGFALQRWEPEVLKQKLEVSLSWVYDVDLKKIFFKIIIIIPNVL